MLSPRSSTSGEYVRVTTTATYPAATTVSCNVDHGGAPCPDSLTVTNECHEGRAFPNPILRELLRAFGVRVCPDCQRVTAIATRSGWRER